jgi:hypothetical protein
MRATLDKLISWGGLLLAALLLVAGGLLTWASSFIANQVTDQLGAQNITMPTSQAYGELPKSDQEALAPYAGQKMTTGSQAKVYANNYIGEHLKGVADGQTYSEVSGQYIQQCSDPKAATSEACTTLAGQRQTLFMGTTLRGLLLYGYAFATMGTIAGYGAIVCFVGAGLMLILVGFGFWHSRRAKDEAAESQPVGAHV